MAQEGQPSIGHACHSNILPLAFVPSKCILPNAASTSTSWLLTCSPAMHGLDPRSPFTTPKHARTPFFTFPWQERRTTTCAAHRTMLARKHRVPCSEPLLLLPHHHLRCILGTLHAPVAAKRIIAFCGVGPAQWSAQGKVVGASLHFLHSKACEKHPQSLLLRPHSSSSTWPHASKPSYILMCAAEGSLGSKFHLCPFEPWLRCAAQKATTPDDPPLLLWSLAQYRLLLRAWQQSVAPVTAH